MQGIWTAVGEPSQDRTISMQVSPNPVREVTTIRFTLDQDSQANLAIYNLNGQIVGQLCNEKLPKGTHEFRWNCNGIAPGVYVVRLQSGSTITTNKIILAD
jgi:hypothetical protein